MGIMGLNLSEVKIDEMAIYPSKDNSVVLFIKGEKFIESEEDDSLIPTRYNVSVMVDPDAQIDKRVLNKFKKVAAIATLIGKPGTVWKLITDFLEVNDFLDADFTIPEKVTESRFIYDDNMPD